MSTENKRRALPSVDSLLNSPTGSALVRDHGHLAVVVALRAALDDARARLAADDSVDVDAAALLDRATTLVTTTTTPTLRGLINATGVVIHTNLGRAPLAAAALVAMGVERHGMGAVALER